MATTTASFTLNSPDILSNAISLSSIATLYNGGTTSTGLTQIKSGRVNVYVTGASFDLIPALASEEASAVNSYVYISNKNADKANYVNISIYNEVIGRLYGGDWMFIPYEQNDPVADNGSDNDIEVEALVGGPQAVEWMMFTDSTATILDASGD
tara:strand:- start:116 stop:577 length:462 start_codon:yes stop_codon:yes gene_type:complete